LGLGVLGLAFIGVRQHPARVAPSRSQSATCEGSAGSDTINHRSRHGVLEVLEQELELAAWIDRRTGFQIRRRRAAVGAL